MPFKPCKPNQKRNPETNRCKNKLSFPQIPETTVPDIPNVQNVQDVETIQFIDDVDSLFGLFNTELISLVDMDERSKRLAIQSFSKSGDMGQLLTVCQGAINGSFIRDTLKDDISHILLLRVKNLVVSYAFLTERKTKNNVNYMYINIICSRKFSSTGKHMLLAAENVALRRGLSFTALSSLFTAIGFYKTMGYQTIPIEQACKSSKIDIIDIAEKARKLLDSSPINLRNIRLRDVPENSLTTNIAIVLKWMRFSKQEIILLIKSNASIMKKWEKDLKSVDLNNYFDKERLLFMTKCLK